MGILFVDVEAISFCFLVFPSNTQAPLLQDSWRPTPDPANLGITLGGCRTVRVAAGFFFCYLCLRKVPTRCQLELSFMRCLFGSTVVKEPLEKTVCPLSEFKCYAGSSVVLFGAAGQVSLSLLQQNS